jgi:hypothetical protein
MIHTASKRLEAYTLKKPQEVLIVEVEIDGERQDRLIIFKGFSSSLMRPTAFDPDVPVLPQEAKIIKIDRLRSPYKEDSPDYLQQGLTWASMDLLLQALGV